MHVAGIEVEIVARPIKVRRHRGDIVATVLFAIRLAKLDARDLRHRIPFVRRLERAGKERLLADRLVRELGVDAARSEEQRSEEHTSELQSIIRISLASFCL